MRSPTALASAAQVRPREGQTQAACGAGGAWQSGLGPEDWGLRKRASRSWACLYYRKVSLGPGRSQPGGQRSQPLPYPSQPSANVRSSRHTHHPVTSRSGSRGPEQDLGICVSICAARAPTELLDSQHLEDGSWGWEGPELGRPHGEPGEGLTAPEGLALAWPSGSPLSPQLWEQERAARPSQGPSRLGPPQRFSGAISTSTAFCPAL